MTQEQTDARVLQRVTDKPGIQAGEIPVSQRGALRRLELAGKIAYLEGWYKVKA